MVLAELRRKNHPRPNCEKITTNTQLLSLARKLGVQDFYLFRAGLIINKTLLNSEMNFYNFHCAKIPEYGGLGSIQKAIHDKSLDQEVTLHHVTSRIDKGRVILTKPYTLDLSLSYAENEERAYDAGIALLSSFVSAG